MRWAPNLQVIDKFPEPVCSRQRLSLVKCRSLDRGQFRTIVGVALATCKLLQIIVDALWDGSLRWSCGFGIGRPIRTGKTLRRM
jgi:hypothetical protein